jgi:hypothetical protein
MKKFIFPILIILFIIFIAEIAVLLFQKSTNKNQAVITPSSSPISCVSPTPFPDAA